MHNACKACCPAGCSWSVCVMISLCVCVWESRLGRLDSSQPTVGASPAPQNVHTLYSWIWKLGCNWHYSQPLGLMCFLRYFKSICRWICWLSAEYIKSSPSMRTFSNMWKQQCIVCRKRRASGVHTKATWVTGKYEAKQTAHHLRNHMSRSTQSTQMRNNALSHADISHVAAFCCIELCVNNRINMCLWFYICELRHKFGRVWVAVSPSVAKNEKMLAECFGHQNVDNTLL